MSIYPSLTLYQTNEMLTLALLSYRRDNPLWEYAFRFLRCSLLSQSQDLTSAINALRKIRSIAEKRHDESIYILSSLIEAMIHLQNGPDGAENAEECLAKANSRQLSNIQPPPQLDFLRALVDLVGSLMLGAKNSDVDIKLRNLQNLLGQRERLLEWSLGGDFELPVNSSRPGKPIEKLEFRWMAREDIIVLGYFLSGMARFQSNTQELGKAELYLKEGLRRVDC